MNKNTVFALVCATLLAGPVHAESLSDLHAIEAAESGQSSSVERLGRLGSGSGSHSPSQVVILNNTPNTRQDSEQNQMSEQGQGQYQDQRLRQRQQARIGVGTGESLEALREGRIQKEAKNEQILMEKLEHSRIEDEKSRLRRLFKIREYNKRRHAEMDEEHVEFGDSASDYEHEEDTYYSRKKVRHESHQPVINVVIPEATAVATNNVVTPDAPAAHTSYDSMNQSWLGSAKGLYIKGGVGIGSYKASNSGFSTGNWGLGLGKNISPRVFVEANLNKTTYEIDDPRASQIQNCQFNCNFSQLRDLNQYNFTGMMGFNLIRNQGFTGGLKAGLSYVRRDSESSDIAGFESFRSNTIDGLIGANAEVALANNIALVGSVDYYTNLLNDIASTNSDTVERVETSDYYVLGVGLKFEF
jgi:hypothetical protein